MLKLITRWANSPRSKALRSRRHRQRQSIQWLIALALIGMLFAGPLTSVLGALGLMLSAVAFFVGAVGFVVAFLTLRRRANDEKPLFEAVDRRDQCERELVQGLIATGVPADIATLEVALIRDEGELSPKYHDRAPGQLIEQFKRAVEEEVTQRKERHGLTAPDGDSQQ